MSTMPSVRFSSALTGQIVTHGAFEQWLAAQNREMPSNLGEKALSRVLDPGPETASGTSVSQLASDGAGVATDATPVIHQEPYCIAHSNSGVTFLFGAIQTPGIPGYTRLATRPHR